MAGLIARMWDLMGLVIKRRGPARLLTVADHERTFDPDVIHYGNPAVAKAATVHHIVRMNVLVVHR